MAAASAATLSCNEGGARPASSSRNRAPADNSAAVASATCKVRRLHVSQAHLRDSYKAQARPCLSQRGYIEQSSVTSAKLRYTDMTAAQCQHNRRIATDDCRQAVGNVVKPPYLCR
jgi:hypothetical protein